MPNKKKPVKEIDTPYWTAKEAALYLRCSPKWLVEQARKKRIRHRRCGWNYLFTREMCDEMVSNNKRR